MRYTDESNQALAFRDAREFACCQKIAALVAPHETATVFQPEPSAADQAAKIGSTEAHLKIRTA
jgi:hypothetical protein